MADSVIIIAVVLTIFLFLFMSILGVSVFIIEVERDEACKRIGYDEYSYGKCVDETSYLEVYVDCNRGFFPTRCDVKLQDTQLNKIGGKSDV